MSNILAFIKSKCSMITSLYSRLKEDSVTRSMSMRMMQKRKINY